jgi:hypothetical protein
MEFELKDNELVFERELSNLDKLVLKFIKLLDDQGIKHVIISGYVAIFFGRSRETEDVDLFIEEIDLEQMKLFWKALDEAGFECINAFTPEEALGHLKDNVAIRLALKGTWIPNFEVKFPETELNQYSLDNALSVKLNKKYHLNISILELQIPFKLYLGSEKDIEDAIHLWTLFKNKLNLNLFNKFVEKLNVKEKLKELE